MDIVSKIKEYSFYIASFGGLGKAPGGGILASTIAIPIVFVGRLLYLISNKAVYWYFSVYVLLTALLIQLALNAYLEEFSSSIVIDKILGVCIAIYFLPFDLHHWKIIFFSFLFFHALHLLSPIFRMNDFLKKLDSLPGALGILSFDILFGLATCLIAQLALLFLH